MTDPGGWRRGDVAASNIGVEECANIDFPLVRQNEKRGEKPTQEQQKYTEMDWAARNKGVKITPNSI